MRSQLWILVLPALIATAPTVEAATPRLWTYPAPDQEDYKSQHYTAEVAQNSNPQEVFVYQTLCPWHHYYKQPWVAKIFAADNNWVTFSSIGEVVVTIKPIGVVPESVELRPAPEAVTSAIVDGAVKVTVARPGQYFVLINGEHGMKHPFFIFANPPEEEAPQEGTKGVHYFGPGVHDIGYKYPVKANETVYLAGGALVKGSIHYKGDNVTIRGRGILTDKKLMLERYELAHSQKKAGVANVWDINHDKWYEEGRATIYGEGRNVRIEGLTIIESPFYMVRTHGPGSTFTNLKLLSDLYNNNGIIAGRDHKIIDCFFKVEDDVFCWMSPISETRNCVIWKQTNACMVQMGYGYSYKTYNHLFIDNSIIVDQTCVQNMARGLFGLASSIGTEFDNCLIENMKVYGDTLNLMAIDNLNHPTPWSATPTKPIVLKPITLYFKNVEITGTERGTWWGERVKAIADQPVRSRLRTKNEGSIEITLDNVTINGKRLRCDEDWPNGLLKGGNVTTIYK